MSSSRRRGLLPHLLLVALIAVAAGATNSAGAVEGVPDPHAKLAMFDPQSGEWHVRYADGAVDTFFYGTPGDVPLLGDWDCDGIDTVAMFRPSNGFIYLRNTNTFGVADEEFFYGLAGDIPLAGDGDGDGCDTFSIYRPNQGRVYVSNRLGTSPADYSFYFGIPGDRPFAGDFDGDGITSVGLYRESSGFVYFRNSLTTGVAEFEFFYGVPSDIIVAGDWDGDGDETVGVFRPVDRYVFLSNENTQGFADIEFGFGRPDWIPVAGEIGIPSHPGDTVDCADFPNQGEAQQWHDFYAPFYGDVARLDSDANGVACEGHFGNTTTTSTTSASTTVTTSPTSSTSTTSTTSTTSSTTSTTSTSSTTSTTSTTTTTQPIPDNPGDVVDCGDFATKAAAQAWFDTYFPHYGDVADLDTDGDLFACDIEACSLSAGSALQPNEGLTNYILHQRPEGTVDIVMLFVDFPDAPASESTADLYNLLVPDAQQWFTEVSNGAIDLRVDRVDSWFRMPRPSYEYGFSDGLTFEEHRVYMADAIGAADPEVDFTQHDLVYVVSSAGAAIPFSPTFLPYPGFGIMADGVELRLAVTFGRDIRINRENQAPMIFVHETGHVLGLPDTYLWNTPGPHHISLMGGWDPMSYLHPGGHFNAWHKLKLGWIDDGQVICLTAPFEATVDLSPLSAAGGTKAVIVKTGESTAYVAEIRRPIGLDARLCDEGMVVYHIDATVPNGEGPMVLQPAKQGTDPATIAKCGPLYDASFDLGAGEIARFDSNDGVSFELDSIGSGVERVGVFAY